MTPESALTIVIPMAGIGSRFRDAGYALPKPLIEVEGKPMIERVLENIALPQASILLIAAKADLDQYPEAFARLQGRYGCRCIAVEGRTEGAACTLLHAVQNINNDTPLLIANSDQLVDLDMRDFVGDAAARGLEGSILTFPEPSLNPKWSYAAVTEEGLATQVREKVAISEHATVGIYWFARGRYFVEAACAMIARNDRCNNEFYLCPVYNYLIARELKIGLYEISKVQMHGLGTPEDLDAYLRRQR